MADSLITCSAYRTFICEKRHTAVLFYADWERYHQQLEGDLEELPAGTGVGLGKVNVDEPKIREELKKLNLLNLPTIVYYRDGAPVEVSIGVRSRDEIQERIRSLMRNQPMG